MAEVWGWGVRISLMNTHIDFNSQRWVRPRCGWINRGWNPRVLDRTVEEQGRAYLLNKHAH